MEGLINENGSINFSKADLDGNNTLTAQELVTALRDAGKTDLQIQTALQNLTINVDSAAEGVTLDLNDSTDLGVLDFDALTVTDSNDDATDFTIFVADTDGLIINTNVVGSALADGTSDVATVLVTDSLAGTGMTFVNNALSVALDATDWEAEFDATDAQYQLVFNIDNNVTLTGAIAGYGNSVTISGDMAFEQNDENGFNNGIIDIEFNVGSTVATDLIYDVNITDTVTTTENVGMLAAGVQVRVSQDDNILATSGNLSVDTDSTVGTETTRRDAYGYQLQNWVADVTDAEILYNGVTYNATWIAGMAAAMLDESQTQYQGVNINTFVTALQNGSVKIIGDAEQHVVDASGTAFTWTAGNATGSWHNFYITTDITKKNEQNSGGTFFLPEEVYAQLRATHPFIFGKLGSDKLSDSTYSNYGSSSINNLYVEWPVGSGTQVKVMNLIAGGGTGTVTTGTRTESAVEYTAISHGADDFQLTFGQLSYGAATVVADNSRTITLWNDGAACRSCDPVAMIIFEQASGDLSGLLASTDNDMNFLGEDFSQRTIETAENAESLINNVEMQTGVFMGSGTTGVTDGPTAYIDQTITRAASGQGYNVTGTVGDAATYVEGYTSVAAADDQVYAGYTGPSRVNDALRAFLLVHLSNIPQTSYQDGSMAAIPSGFSWPTIEEFLSGEHPLASLYYNDDLAEFLIDNPGEMTDDMLNNMIAAYANGQISAENFAGLLDVAVDQKIVENKTDMYQVFMSLGISEDNVSQKVIDLFNYMEADALELALDTLLEFVGADAIASIYFQVTDVTEFNAALVDYFESNGSRSQELANALVSYLNDSPTIANVNRFVGLIDAAYLEYEGTPPSEKSMDIIANAFENDWNQTVFSKIAFTIIGRATAAGHNFSQINMLLSKINSVDVDDLFVEMIAEASDSTSPYQSQVQIYLQEAIVSASRGIVNASTSALGQIQAKAILYAASQNIDPNAANRGDLSVFGIHGDAAEAGFVDDIVLAAENLYQVADESLKAELVDTMLMGILGFDTGATPANSQYYNNMKRIAFIAQGQEGSLLYAIGHSGEMNRYLTKYPQIMTNDLSSELRQLTGGKSAYVGQDLSTGFYHINYLELTVDELSLIANDGVPSFAQQFGNSYRAYMILGSKDRSSLVPPIALDYTQDVSDWMFTSTVDSVNPVDPVDPVDPADPADTWSQNRWGDWIYTDPATPNWSYNNSTQDWIYTDPNTPKWSYNSSTKDWTYSDPANPNWSYNNSTQDWIYRDTASPNWSYNNSTQDWTYTDPTSPDWSYNNTTQAWTYTSPTDPDWSYNNTSQNWIYTSPTNPDWSYNNTTHAWTNTSPSRTT